MRTIVVIPLLFFGLISQAQGTEKLDTIYCDIQNTSSIILPEAVAFIDIGNINDYAGQIKNNIVFIKPLRENLATTTLLINTASRTYYSTIAWKPKAKKYFYDFQKPVPSASSKSVPITAPASKSEASAGTEEKLNRFKELPTEIKTIGVVGTLINASVATIRNDYNNTYLKIVLSNKSSIPYKLDFISFQYYQDMKKGAIRKAKKVPLDVFPVLEPSIHEIAPSTTTALYYVIPTYALSNKGFLLINIREKAGDRIMSLKIKGKTIQKSGSI